MTRLIVILGLAVAAIMSDPTFSAAQISDDVVKIGVLSDMSSLYSELDRTWLVDRCPDGC